MSNASSKVTQLISAGIKLQSPGSLAGGLKGHPFNPVPYFQDHRSQTDPHLHFSSIVNTVVKLTTCYSEIIHGRVTWAARAFCPGRPCTWFNVLLFPS